MRQCRAEGAWPADRPRRHRHGGYGRPYGRGYGGPGRRGPRARRGDVRTAILLLLAEEPRNGYGLMQEIEQRTGGAWKPSPGSVYPQLQQLEDEGLVRGSEEDGRRVLDLTEEGRALVAERDSKRPAPWEEFSRGVDDEARAAVDVLRQVGAAVGQIAQVATREQQVAAREILEQTRRSLYGLLAGGSQGPGDTAGSGGAGKDREAGEPEQG